ncbi:hypothetical protein [Microvirga sp. Mcv34]|uniref:hypothetical protein n=1 Tax=Microvirga sp. Mcv34 TaxID=2926016 RepID=UPI0021C9D9AD|nr:hypothetical protein [Microvirga sp. Mcv34]
MNQRKLSHALGPADVRMLSETAHAAERLGLPFTALVTIHFGLVMPPPADPGRYLRREVINRFGIWFRRRDIIWTALWVRENFIGQYREHVHLLVHIPRKVWGAFAAAAQRWWPQPGAVDVRRAYNVERTLRYLSKQLSPQARFAFRGLIWRESRCRYTGARLAPVLGRRFGMTTNLKRHLLAARPQRSRSEA